MVVSITQLIQEKINYVINHPDLPAPEAAEIATYLSAMLGSVGEHVAQLENEANNIQTMAFSTGEDGKDVSVGKAEVLMKASPQYMEYKKAKALQLAVEQTIISLRHVVQSANKEYNLTQ